MISHPGTALRLGQAPSFLSSLSRPCCSLCAQTRGGLRRGEGGGDAEAGERRGGARWQGTPSLFPVRVARLFPNLPPSPTSRPGKAPRRPAAPRCADHRACGDGRAPAGTRPLLLGKRGRPREPVPGSHAPLRGRLCSPPHPPFCISAESPPRAGPPGGGGLPPSRSNFWFFSNLCF